jgi:acetyl-CoA/propionyl-CoA carboxylase biotin carboxyl carrier protein
MSGLITKVLIANRGEIAVRIARAAKDSGRKSVAVYADQDRDSLHVRVSDEAYALNGTTSAETYLVIEKLLSIAKRSNCNAVHPGYGFLAENAEFARAVSKAGLIWIGPTPEAIERLGDKVSARHVAEKVGAPLAPGTLNPVKNAKEVLDFVSKHGLPVAIKAAYGGGGRGIKVAYQESEVAELFESATREAVAAFGRGECFVEKYLEKPRHVETQCLADSAGNVVVVSTRDCSLQRRHQKLVEEAPAPFLTAKQTKELYESSKAILREVGYIGAGTCEFLVAQDGTISFLEVNTRLQVEHPVSEEVTGLDLVREQFRIAEGGLIDYPDPEVSGHSGVESGDSISGNFDSMIAKLIVTGKDRTQALERSRRALAELQVLGLPTVIPFHRKIVNDPAFVASDGKFGVYTRWIETEWVNDLEPWSGLVDPIDEISKSRKNVVVEVDGKRIEVSLPARMLQGGSASATGGRAPKRKISSHHGSSGAGNKSIKAPMQSTVVKLAVAAGDKVVEGDQVLVLEAMKMEQSISSPRNGVIKAVKVSVGETVPSGTVLIEFED